MVVTKSITVRNAGSAIRSEILLDIFFIFIPDISIDEHEWLQNEQEKINNSTFRVDLTY